MVFVLFYDLAPILKVRSELVLLMVVFCSLCNTNVTSQQTLLLHAEGKKHIAKAKAFHGAKQPKQAEGTLLNNDVPAESNAKNEAPEATEKEKEQKPSDIATKDNSVADNGNLQLNRKRKLEASEDIGARQKPGVDMSNELGNGEIIQVGRSKAPKDKDKKVEQSVSKDDKAMISSSKKEDEKKKIKWKKLITSSLRSVRIAVLWTLHAIYIFGTSNVFIPT